MTSDNIIFLLGAGASKDAGLKTSDEMSVEVERLLAGEWGEYEKVYNAVKAGMLYGSALKGRPRQSINIEEFVNVLTELSRCKDHIIFPFIASWNMELMETAGKDFTIISQLKNAIVEKLVNEWVNLQDRRSAYYYYGLRRLAADLGSNLRVFSLNYDLCVEAACGNDGVFTGFERVADRNGRVWNDRLMGYDDERVDPVRLYKLHGSVDWRNENGVLVSYDSPNKSDKAEDYQLIFGTSNKMRYTEPYLFLLSEFRKYTFSAKLIICVGYSFQDAHINSILNHAFSNKSKTHILVVSWANEESRGGKEAEIKKQVAKELQIDERLIFVSLVGAKQFMENEMTVDALEKLLPKEIQPF